MFLFAVYRLPGRRVSEQGPLGQQRKYFHCAGGPASLYFRLAHVNKRSSMLPGELALNSRYGRPENWPRPKSSSHLRSRFARKSDAMQEIPCKSLQVRGWTSSFRKIYLRYSRFLVYRIYRCMCTRRVPKKLPIFLPDRSCTAHRIPLPSSSRPFDSETDRTESVTNGD